jgi:hypothetical protein
LVSFQVTRRRRNRSGVSQIPISRAAITWSIQISSCTRNAVGAMRQPGPRSDDGGRSVDKFITDPPPRCRRDLRRLPQELRQDGQLCSLLILILLLCARQFGRHKSRLGCRLNAGDADGGVPTERRRSEGTTTKESPNQEPGHLVTWCLFK